MCKTKCVGAGMVDKGDGTCVCASPLSWDDVRGCACPYAYQAPVFDGSVWTCVENCKANQVVDGNQCVDCNGKGMSVCL